MQNVKRLLVDVSSLCWTGLFSGEDKEFGYVVQHDGKDVKISSAEFGMEYAIDLLVSTMGRFGIVPSEIIFVVEGNNSKALRKSIYPEYKGKPDNRAPESYTEFGRMRDMLTEQFRALGSSIVTQDGIEADDVLAYLALNLEGEVYILSNDKDMAVLVNDRIHQLRQGEVDQNAFGPFPHKYITLYLALCGDASDNYPGAKGFGPKAFLDLYCMFGEEGLDALIDMIERKKLEELAEDVGELKSLQKIIDSKDLVYTCWELAKLYPEKVNILRRPLQWKPGMVKPVQKGMDSRLKQWAGQVRLVHKGNYQQAVEFFKSKIAETPYFTIDIETTTPEESDDWLMRAKGKSDEDKDLGVDVFGSSLVGLGITFGANRQFTFYFTVKHVETDQIKNVTSLEVLELIDQIPLDKPNVIQNVSFELTVLYQEWAEYWDNGEWRGFIPNAIDTKIMASYVDENIPKGLKQRSLAHLGYEQETFQHVTTISGDVNDLPPGGRVLSEEDHPEIPDLTIQTRQYKMDELTAEHVLHYGSDDTVCTSALFSWYRIIMELEKTWQVFQQVEILPAYVTALAFVQGTKVSLQRLKELEKEDDIAHAEAKKILDEFLISKGWDGTVCPVYDEITVPAIKEAYEIVMGEPLKNQTRTVSKYPAILDEAGAHLLATIVANNDVEGLNQLVKSRFDGTPKLNFDSPKQVQRLLYDVIGIPVRIVNSVTPKERQDKPELAAAISKFNKLWQGSKSVVLTDEDRELAKAKASTDDTAVDFALAMDATDEQKVILNAMTTLKTVETRRKLYYRPYPLLSHWKDGKLHSSMNQSEAVTRRYSSGGPNLQQLPKKGEGVKVREILVPHKPDAVICSIDFSGQELRLMAGQSLDPNMMACYVGSKLKDIHSITASGAMVMKWTKAVVDELAAKYGGHLDPKDVDYIYDLFVTLHKKVEEKEIRKKADDLRKDAKNVNFAAQFDAQAAKLAQMLIMSVEEAQGFLDAKYTMFPRVETWKDEVRAQLMRDGYVTTMLGGRRHLRDAVLNENKWEAERAGRQGPNFKIQGSAAEMTKLAMGRVWKSGIQFSLDMVFIAPVHDELVWSVTIEDAFKSIEAVHAAMTAPYADLPVPIIGSISLGPDFGRQIELGEVPDRGEFVKGLNLWLREFDHPTISKLRQFWSEEVEAVV